MTLCWTMRMADKSSGWMTWGSRLPRAPGRRGAAILLFSYALGFALPIVGAIMSLVAAHHGAHATARADSLGAELLTDVIPLALSLLATILGIRTAARAPLALGSTELGLRRADSISRAWAAATALMYLAAITAADSTTHVLLSALSIQSDAPTAPTDGLTAAIVNSSGAGLVEEPILLGLTIGLAVRLRWRWWAVVPLMIVMRGAFHVYYGPGVLFVIPWMVGAYLLYRRCPLLWPFVLAHGVYDVLVTLAAGAPHTAAATASVIHDVLAVFGILTAAGVAAVHFSHGLGRADPAPA